MNLGAIERACQDLFEVQDQQQQEAAKQLLAEFDADPNCIPNCMHILQSSTNSYAQLLSTTTLRKRLTSNPGAFSTQERLRLRSGIMSLLAQSPNIEAFVSADMCKLVARITKVSWFDKENESSEDFVFRGIGEETMQFIRSGKANQRLGLMLLKNIVEDMSDPTNMRSVSRHSKTSASFKEWELKQIFVFCLEVLRTCSSSESLETVHQLLALARGCVVFDFNSASDPNDDFRLVAFPKCWKECFLRMDPLGLLLQFYNMLQPPESAIAMETLVQLVSMRSVDFSKSERKGFLNSIVQLVLDVIQSGSGLSHQDNHHQFSRLLSRMKTSILLEELLGLPNMDEFIGAVTNFTIQSIESWHISPNSLHYLFSFWERTVNMLALNQLPADAANAVSCLKAFCSRVGVAYIKMRIGCVEHVVRGAVDDPLDDTTIFDHELKRVAVISRCQFAETCELLVSILEPGMMRFWQYISAQAQGVPLADKDRQDMLILEGQLVWVVYFVGAILGQRVSSIPVNRETDEMDGELVYRVLSLVKYADQRTNGPDERMVRATVFFFRQFRTAYLTEATHDISVVHRKLSEALGIDAKTKILDLFVNRIILNLKIWPDSEDIIFETLRLFSELCTSHVACRQLLKLDPVKYIFSNHGPEEFPFLNAVRKPKMRSMFYESLGKLVSFSDAKTVKADIEVFMRPFGQTAKAILEQFSMGNLSPELRTYVIGFARDLRGLLEPLKLQTFMYIFDYVFPDYMAIFVQGLTVWYSDPDVTNAILKCMVELAYNRSKRLTFPVSSPNGVLLFRELSKVVCVYTERIVTVTGIPDADLYRRKYKGMTQCFKMLRVGMTGEYVNFGVFKLYGDTALEVALEAFFKLAGAIPINDLLEYPKLREAYYKLIECVTMHMEYVTRLDSATFRVLATTLMEGTRCLEVTTSSAACKCLDKILTFAQENLFLSKLQQQAEALAVLVQNNADVFVQAFEVIFNIYLFEMCKNPWSMSRPLLSLCILYPQAFEKLKVCILASFPSANHQELLKKKFSEIEEGIEPNLTSGNRDNFTSQLSSFRLVIDKLKAGAEVPKRTLRASAATMGSSAAMMPL